MGTDGIITEVVMDYTPPNNDRWWKNRRRMAWLSLAVAFVETIALGILGLCNPAALTAMSVAIGWSYGLWGTIISTYIGFSAWADIAATRK